MNDNTDIAYQKGPAQHATPAKFVQISSMPGCIGGHEWGLFALDSAGIVWNYEGEERGWEAITSKRGANAPVASPQGESK